MLEQNNYNNYNNYYYNNYNNYDRYYYPIQIGTNIDEITNNIGEFLNNEK